jgi:hypothetical protein
MIERMRSARVLVSVAFARCRAGRAGVERPRLLDLSERERIGR